MCAYEVFDVLLLSYFALGSWSLHLIVVYLLNMHNLFDDLSQPLYYLRCVVSPKSIDGSYLFCSCGASCCCYWHCGSIPWIFSIYLKMYNAMEFIKLLLNQFSIHVEDCFYLGWLSFDIGFCLWWLSLRHCLVFYDFYFCLGWLTMDN